MPGMGVRFLLGQVDTVFYTEVPGQDGVKGTSIQFLLGFTGSCLPNQKATHLATAISGLLQHPRRDRVMLPSVST